MKKANLKKLFRITVLLCILHLICSTTFAKQKPNIVLIYSDDVGYGDLSCYGAEEIATPNIDQLSNQGLRFTNAHSSSATCTPSRYSLLTGEYAWRKEGTEIAQGDAPLIISTQKESMASMLQKAGYTTGVIGKWHLGLGSEGGPDWNAKIKPGPTEIGFDYSFLIPATGDRVPCVFVENQKVVGLDPDDPIKVNYNRKIGGEPTGKENPELLKMHPSFGHDMAIVNGISRIGYMTGGESALWKDENIAQNLTKKAMKFIKDNKDRPFFLYFATHDIHVPRAPDKRFIGKSGMGPRGDAILQLDWCVGEITSLIKKLGLQENTLIIFTSDNGPVADDGYEDQAVELMGKHRPSGILRGGKGSVFEAGTRVPFIVSWPSKVEQGVSSALISQVDLFASFADLANQRLVPDDAPDSYNLLAVLLGKSTNGRDFLIEHGFTLALIKGDWKYIRPSNYPPYRANVNTEFGTSTKAQLYNLSEDLVETNNLAEQHPNKVDELADLLESIEQGKKPRHLLNNFEN